MKQRRFDKLRLWIQDHTKNIVIWFRDCTGRCWYCGELWGRVSGSVQRARWPGELRGWECKEGHGCKR